MSGLTLDAGALIAFERNDRRVVAMVAGALARGVRLAVPAGVVGQVWRDGRKQARLARFLGSPVVEIEPLDDRRARAAGQLCGVKGTADVIDASVVLCAKSHGHGIATSDPRISLAWTRRFGWLSSDSSATRRESREQAPPGTEQPRPSEERARASRTRPWPRAEQAWPRAEQAWPRAEQAWPRAEQACPRAEQACPRAEQARPRARRTRSSRERARASAKRPR